MRYIIVILLGLFLVGNVYADWNPGDITTERILNDIYTSTGSAIAVSQDVLIDARDGITNAIQTIEYEHHEIHSGSAYHYMSHDILGSGETANFSFTTPSGLTKTHMTYNIQGNQPFKWGLYEDGTLSDAGIALTPVNMNRDSSNTSGMDMSRDVTITTYGTTLEAGNVGLAGTGPQSSGSGGTASRTHEWILDDGSKYLFAITSDAATNTLTYNFHWYEHEDKR